MQDVFILDRKTKKIEKESIYFEEGIRFLYGKSFLSRTLGRFVLHALAKWPLTSYLVGKLQDRPSSRKKILPFIQEYQIDEKEFEKESRTFSSFNDFFVRKLKPEARPIDQESHTAVMPADARYQFFQQINKGTPFKVKEEQFSLKKLFQNDALAAKYEGGSMVIARLCPTDCHRFYFPFACVAEPAQEINGKLFSVNPIAIKDNPWIWAANFRVLTKLKSSLFGDVAFFEVGATSVGSIKQTFTPFAKQEKGAEKGYFAFGSALIILFEKNKIVFDQDLLDATAKDIEIRCLIGESMGKAVTNKPAIE